MHAGVRLRQERMTFVGLEGALGVLRGQLAAQLEERSEQLRPDAPQG